MIKEKSKNILITGVSRLSGIGFATAKHLAKSGYNICFTHLSGVDKPMPGWIPQKDEITEIRKQLKEYETEIVDYEIDLKNIHQFAELFDFVEMKLGSIYGLINNATVSIDTNIENLSAQVIDAHYYVNIRAPMLLTQELFLRHKTQYGLKSGRIINLTSGYPLEANPGNLAYASSKESLNRFVRSVASEIAPLGITINSVDPGPTDTGWMTKELKVALESHAPMGRVGQPEDVAKLIRFLVSDDSEWITGQIINSRGGF